MKDGDSINKDGKCKWTSRNEEFNKCILLRNIYFCDGQNYEKNVT